MPRTVKESEDEGEIKIGRRTRTYGSNALSVVDSPLRRSTRNKQPTNHDDESSPESIASDATVTSTRSIRRRTVTVEHSLVDNSRSLRSRKNSNASDITDIADTETGDMKKRITRRSVAAIPVIETPSKTRLRRSTRAGSETKTMSPSVRTTRRTRASSVDLEDNDEMSRDQSININTNTPLKSRNRACALPSEPPVIEESEILIKEVLSNNEHDPKNKNTSTNNLSTESIKSSVSRLKFDENQVNEQPRVAECCIEEPMSDTMKSHDDVFESPSNNSSISPKSPCNAEIKGKLTENCGEPLMELSKIILYKVDMPSQKSPGNKENEKLNVMSDKKMKKFHSNNLVSQRKSANFTSTKKIQLEDRLNKSVDDNLLTTIDNQSMSASPSSCNLSKLKSSETSMINIRSLVDKDNVPAEIRSTNESVVCLGENTHHDNHTKYESDNSNDETIYIEPKSRRKSWVSPTDKKLNNNIASEVDTTVGNHVNECTVNSNDSISNDARIDDLESSKIMDGGVSNANSDGVSEIIIEDNIESVTPLSRKSIDERTEIISTSITSEPQEFGVAASSEDNDTAEIQIVSTDEVNNDNNVHKKINKNEKNRLSLNKYESTPKRSYIPKSTSKIGIDSEDKNDNNSEDDETDVENLFQDISAEEWKLKHVEQSMIDECGNADDEREEMNHQDKIFSDKISWKITPKEGDTNPRDTSDCDSDDTVVVQTTTNARLKYSKAEHSPAVIDEPMEIDDNDTEIDLENNSTVANTHNKSLSKKRKSLSKCPNENNDNYDKNTEEERLDQDITFVPEHKSINESDTVSPKMPIASSTDTTRRNLTDFKSTKSTSRKSLNIQSRESTKGDNKLKRRTIEVMDSTKCNKSPQERISITDNVRHFEDENNELENEERSRKSLNTSRSKSVNKLNSVKTPTHNLIDEETDEDNEIPIQDGSNQRRKSGEKFKLKKDYFSNTSEVSSIDVDVAREINLNGDSITRYSDDDVAGDECRASESEASIEDDDDDDDDMASFIVDDDEEIDEEESDEQNEMSEIESSVETNENHDNETGESADESDIKLRIRSKPLESSGDEEEIGKNDSPELKILVVSNKRLSKKKENNVSMDSSTPKVQKQMCESTVATTPKISSIKKSNDLSKSLFNESYSKAQSEHEINETINTSLQVVKTPKKITNTSVEKCSANNSIKVVHSKLTRSKSATEPSQNYSMQIASTESPEVKLLMKEKLNESLPTLKLKRRSLKSSRRSSLMDVKEGLDEHNDELPEEAKIEYVQSEPVTKPKKKKNKEIIVNDVSENMNTKKSNTLHVTDSPSVEKEGRKKKKNVSIGESDISMIVESEKISNKQKKKLKNQVEPINKSAIDTKELSSKKSKSKSESDSQSLSIKPAKKLRAQSATDKDNDYIITAKITQKDTSKNKVVKSVNNISKIPNVKRLPEDLLENLSDVPTRPKKRRKLDKQVLPSKTMFDVKDSPPINLTIEDVGYIPLSGSGGTSQFSVVNLKKLATKRSKKSSTAWTFRERILARNNIYQPVSAYLMYQQKLKASNNDKR